MSACDIIPRIKTKTGSTDSLLFTEMYNNKIPRSKCLEIFYEVRTDNFFTTNGNWVKARVEWLSGKYKTLEEAQEANGVTIQTDQNGEPLLSEIKDLLKNINISYNLTDKAPVNNEVKDIVNRFGYDLNNIISNTDIKGTKQQETIIQQINSQYKTVEAKMGWNGNVELFVKNTDIPYELKDRTITDPRVDDIINRMKDKFPNTIIEKTTFEEANKKYKDLDPRATSFITGNKIVILTDRVSGETTVEEFLHPFTLAISNRNPELFSNLLEEAKNNYPKLVKEIKSNYKRYGQKTIDLEIVTQALSKALHKEYEINDTQSVSQLKKLVDKFFSYLNELLELVISDGNRVYSDMLKPTTTISDLVKLLNTEGLTFETAYDYDNTYYNLDQTSAFVNQTLERDDLTPEAKQTIDKIFKINSKIKYDEVEGTYTNIITGVTPIRLSDFKKGFKYKDTDGYFEFGGNEDDFADNRQWGNIVDEIFTRILVGDSKVQIKNDWKKKTLLSKYESEADITEDVFNEVYEKLENIAKEYNDNGIILLPQIIISNNEKNVAGRTDITAVYPDGSIKIIDLKTTTTPPKSPAYYRVYPTEKGNRASKDESYRFQLSGLKAMFQAQGFIMNAEPTSNIFFTIQNSEEGTVNRINFNGEIEQNSLQEVIEVLNFDNTYKGETFINNPEQVKEGKTILDKVRIILQNRIKLIENQPHLKNQKYKLYQTEKLKSDLSGVESIKGIETFIDDTFNLFFNKFNSASGNYTKGVLEEIKNELNSSDDNIEKLNNLLYYKSLLEGYADIFSDLSYFYREMIKVNPNEIKPGSSLDKLRTIISEQSSIKKLYLEKIPDMIASIYEKNISESLNEDIKEQHKVESDRLAKRKAGGKSVEAGEKRLQNIENKYITENGISKATILQILKEGSNEDIPLIDMWLTPAISSSNPVVALFAKTLKTYLENARLKSFDFAHSAEKAFKEYKGNNNSNNPAEFNKDFYELVTEYDYEGKEVKRYQFISPVDLNSYNKARYDFFESIKDVKEGRNEIIRNWFAINNQALPKESLKINGVTIVKGRTEILNEKKNLVSQGIWSQTDYDYWFNSQVIQDEDGNIEAFIGELSTPNLEIYGNSKYSALQKNPSKKKYYDFLISSYFKSQENYPEDSRPGFIIPSISKNNNDRLRENGVVKYLKYKWAEGTKVLQQDQDYNMEKVSSNMKIIPSYFTQYMNPEDVSLDLISSVMLFNDASLRYGVQSRLVGLAESTLSSVKENAPYKVDTVGTKFIDEAAKKAGVFDTYLKYKKKHNGNNVAALLESFIDMQIYNNQNVAHPINTFIGEIDLNKLAGSLMSWTSTTQLGGLNIMGALANNMVNEISVNIEAATNQFFNTKDMAMAEFTYDKHIGDYLKDFSEPINKSLIGQLIDLYDPMQGEFKDKYGRKVSHGVFKKLWSMDTHFFLMHQTDHRIQVKVMIATLQRTKVKQVIDGVTKEISLFDAYTKDSNGKIKLKQGVILDGNLSENGLVNQDIQNRIHALNKRIFGVYNNFDKVALEKYWYGKLVLMYRKHLIPGFKRRYKSIGTDQELGMVTEGYYNTVLRLVKTDIRELAKSIVSKDSNLSTLEKANAKKALRELMWIAATGALVIVLSAMSKAGDDDEKRILAYPLYLALRLNADLGSYGTFGDPRSGFLPNIQEMIRTTKSPTPATAPIDRFIKVFSQLIDPFETYKRDSGIFKKGDSKLAAEFIRFFGVTGTTFNPENAIDFIERNSN